MLWKCMGDLLSYWQKRWKLPSYTMLINPLKKLLDSHLDSDQNETTSFLCHDLHFLNIWFKSVVSLSSYPVHKLKNKCLQTNKLVVEINMMLWFSFEMTFSDEVHHYGTFVHSANITLNRQLKCCHKFFYLLIPIITTRQFSLLLW